MQNDEGVKDGYLDDYDIEAIARQAVDLLFPDAGIQVEAMSSQATTIPRWGGMATDQWAPRRVIVTIAADNRTLLGVNPDWTRAQALANLLEHLAQACGERFRGRWFTPCPGHDHRSQVTLVGDDVHLVCPSTKGTVSRLTPQQPA